MEGHYSKKQEEYMDNIHLPDSACNSKWEDTLYNPLRGNIDDLLKNSSTDSILYIGCGPDAPLFNCNLNKRSTLNNLNKITFSDISLKYLKDCKTKMNGLRKKLKYVQEDITQGLAEYYFFIMKRIFKYCDSAADLQTKLEDANKSITFLLDNYPCDSDDLNNDLYHFIYSEMVATYTGIPTITFCEKELKQLRSKGFISHEDAESLNKLVLEIWRKYNDKVLENHITNLTTRLKPNGIIVIATDIEKVFDDPAIESISSINTQLSKLIFNDIQPITSLNADDFIEWDDSIRNDNLNINSPSLKPHFHKVVTLAYKKVA